MNTFLKLQEIDENNLDEWYAFDEKEEADFLNEIKVFARNNPTTIENYCKTIIPNENSVLSIIYKALSEGTCEWNAFVFDEFIRIITLAKQNKFNYEYLDLLCYLNLEAIYTNNRQDFYRIMEFLTVNLTKKDDPKLTYSLLDLISWVWLTSSDDDDDEKQNKHWFYKIADYANDGPLKQRLIARDILEFTSIASELKPLSIIDKFRKAIKIGI